MHFRVKIKTPQEKSVALPHEPRLSVKIDDHWG